MDFKEFLDSRMEKEYVLYEYEIKASEAKKLYDEWAEDNEGREMSVTQFGTMMGDHFLRERRKDGVYYLGVRKYVKPKQEIPEKFHFIFE